MTKLILPLIFGLFTSHLFASENTLYEEVVFNKPEVGSTTEVYLGDRMLSQQIGEWKECITPKKTYSKTWMGETITYNGKKPICKRTLKSKKYHPTYKFSTGYQGYHVRWKKKGNRSSLCACTSLCSHCVKGLAENAVESGETFIYSENSFQQTIEYAGRSDDVLKFNYSEFTDGFARQAFSREFQVDLSQGNIAAYKGAIIEIIEATNLQIKYKVIRNFASDL